MTRRNDASPIITPGLIVSLVILIVFVIGITLRFTNKWPIEKTKDISQCMQHDSMTYTYTNQGDLIQVYVITDPDYGYQYLVSDHGGICIRYME